MHDSLKLGGQNICSIFLWKMLDYEQVLLEPINNFFQLHVVSQRVNGQRSVRMVWKGEANARVV